VQFGALDDFDDPAAGARGGQCRARTLIACVGEDAQNEREQCSGAFVKHERGAITILDIGWVNGGAQQQAERVDEDMALRPVCAIAYTPKRKMDSSRAVQVLAFLRE